jgi:hypothetical protein
MKNFTRVLIPTALLLVLVVIHFATFKQPLSNHTRLYFELALFNVVFWPIVAWIVIKKQKQGKPVSDEMSKKKALKAAAISIIYHYLPGAPC